jgi:hypothetical protein
MGNNCIAGESMVLIGYQYFFFSESDSATGLYFTRLLMEILQLD